MLLRCLFDCLVVLQWEWAVGRVEKVKESYQDKIRLGESAVQTLALKYKGHPPCVFILSILNMNYLLNILFKRDNIYKSNAITVTLGV